MKLEMDVRLSPAQLAEAFCELCDEGQAQFFIEVARVSAAWPGGAGMQWRNVGRHLRTCACSNEETRDLVNEIASAMRCEGEGR